MKGILSIWPILMSMEASQASLHLFGIFDEETGREDGSQAETEKRIPCRLSADIYDKSTYPTMKYEIADGFIELAGMAWQQSIRSKTNAQGTSVGLPMISRVHQVAQTDKHGTGRSSAMAMLSNTRMMFSFVFLT